MTQTAAAAPSCSLEARDFKERMAWIAALSDKSLRDYRRQGATLTLTYASEALIEVEEMIAREQECCAFLGFNLRKTGGAVELTITVPDGEETNADLLLAPFYDKLVLADASFCCGARSVKTDTQESGRVVGAVAATAATAALACGPACVLPIAFPAIALTSAGSVVAWLGNAHTVATALASVAVLAGWLWVRRQSAKCKARPASTTLLLMVVASLALGGALIWPHVETAILGALSG